MSYKIFFHRIIAVLISSLLVCACVASSNKTKVRLADLGSVYAIHYSQDGLLDGVLDMTFNEYSSISTNGQALHLEKTCAKVISQDTNSELNNLLWNSEGQYIDNRLEHSSNMYTLDSNGRIVNKYNSHGSIDSIYEYDEAGHLIYASSYNTEQNWEYRFEWSNDDLSVIYAHPRWLGIEHGKQCHFNVYIKHSEKINEYNVDLTTILVHEILTGFFTNWSDCLDNWGYFGTVSTHLPMEIYDGSEDFTYHFNYTDIKDGMQIHVKRTPFKEGRPDNLEEVYYVYKDNLTVRKRLGITQ